MTFTCVCGYETHIADAARTHLTRCALAKAPDRPSPKTEELIIILVTALEEMNRIITDALKKYYAAKGSKK